LVHITAHCGISATTASVRISYFATVSLFWDNSSHDSAPLARSFLFAGKQASRFGRSKLCHRQASYGHQSSGINGRAAPGESGTTN
jgi:hypothetical protein